MSALKAMHDWLCKVHKCVLCGEDGVLAQSEGVRCYGCQAYFHQLCIDPLRLHPIETVTSGSPTIWACADCADHLEEALDREDAGEDVDAEAAAAAIAAAEAVIGDSDDADADEVESEDDEDEDEPQDRECAGLCECKCGSTGKTALRRSSRCTCECTCYDSDECDGEDEVMEAFVEEEEETVERLKRGEVVWNRSECTCEVCAEMNLAVEQWPSIVKYAAEDDEAPPIARAVVKATAAAEEYGLNPGLDRILAAAGMRAMTAQQISKRGRL